MARKPAFGAEALEALGAARLAEIILQKAEEDPAFKRRVKAAIAGLGGPAAAAKVIEKRIISLGKAKGRITWQNVKTHRAELSGLLAEITGALAGQDPELAAGLLIRMLATGPAVMERTETSTGGIPGLYSEAQAALGALAARLTPAERARLPDRLMEDLGELAYGPLKGAAGAVLEHLPEPVLAQWCTLLGDRAEERRAREAPERATGHFVLSPAEMWDDVRQMIAVRLGDVDLVLAIEAQKPLHRQRPLDHALMLADAGRYEDALALVRRPVRERPPFMFSLQTGDPEANDEIRQSLIEADILTRMGEPEAAAALRWERFCELLSVKLLKAHVASLPDFDDMEAEEAGFEHALRYRDPLQALFFFLNWPRPDLAARLILARRDEWNGAYWTVLPDVATRLEAEYPLASVILIRALLDDILAASRSQAYGPGATYLKTLERLAPLADPLAGDAGAATHSDWLEALKAAHSRKAGFWAIAEGRAAPSGKSYYYSRRRR